MVWADPSRAERGLSDRRVATALIRPGRELRPAVRASPRRDRRTGAGRLRHRRQPGRGLGSRTRTASRSPCRRPFRAGRRDPRRAVRRARGPGRHRAAGPRCSDDESAAGSVLDGPASWLAGGGGCGIRTLGDPEATTAFEAAPFVRSGNPPPARVAAPRLSGARRRRRCSRAVDSSARTPWVTVDLVVEAGIGAEVVERARGAGLRVGGAEDQAVDPGGPQGAGAHRARLEGDDQGHAVEAPGAPGRGGVAEAEQLGVGGGVAGQLPLVVAAGDHLAVDAARRRRWGRRSCSGAAAASSRASRMAAASSIGGSLLHFWRWT